MSEFSICACLGPREGEPYCMCQMINLGLKKKEDYDWTQEEEDRLNKALDEIFERRQKKEET